MPTFLYHSSMQSARKKAIEIIKKRGGLIRTHEALAEGIHRRTLYALRDEGALIPISRGLYQLSDMEVPAEVGLVEVSKKVPNGVICLISALSFHELTTQNPHYIWLAIERKARKPIIEYPPIRVFFFTGAFFREGVEIHRIMDHDVRIYNAPKTVIDCFRWQHAAGLDVALEAAREYLKRPGSTPATLMEYARICKIEKFVLPYLQAMVA
jgi:predicted transcriptional regulator of viral defense system